MQLPLDILLNNAGTVDFTHTLTENGYDQNFQVNYLGHALLTRLLLENIFRASHSKIVSVSSYAHQTVDKPLFDKPFNPSGALLLYRMLIIF